MGQERIPKGMIYHDLLSSEVPRIHLLRLYGKSSNSGETPRHEADHGSVHQRFAARTKPLVVLAHPPLLIDPRQRTLHHPPTRQHQEAFGGHELAPIHRHALLSLTHQHPFRGWLSGALDEVHTPSQSLAHPIGALVLSAVARVHPQVGEARELSVGSL
jgi:hypothetical protein